MSSSDLEHLSRYRPLIDDWPAFCRAVARPLPPCVWTNTLRTTPDRVHALLEREGRGPEELPWLRGAFKLSPTAQPGAYLPYLAGQYHVQEEVSLLPVVLLDPQPGERVLDMCAAPGGKTAQIAVAMRNRGTVVANDRSWGRARAIAGTTDRLGIVNTCTTHTDAANLPSDAGPFDRVLADVPCTCEGTCRKHPGALAGMSPSASEKFEGVQRAILRKAIQLCRTGGRIVYSTCTFAPEENELVVDALLRETGEAGVALLPVEVPGLTHDPGLTSWKGRRLHSSLRRALRVWPHQNDSGGFFVAVLEKRGKPSMIDLPSIEPHPHDGTWRQRVLDYYGLPSKTLEGVAFVQYSNKYLTAAAPDLTPPQRPTIESAGMPFVGLQWHHAKLKTAAAMAYGASASRQVIDVDRPAAEAYVGRQATAAAPGDNDDGFVIVRYDGMALGVGLLRTRNGTCVLESLYPKAWARPLR